MSIHHPTPPSGGSDLEPTLTYARPRGTTGMPGGGAYAPPRPAPTPPRPPYLPARSASGYGQAPTPVWRPAGAPPWTGPAAPVWPAAQWTASVQPATSLQPATLPPAPTAPPAAPRSRRRTWLAVVALIAVSAAAVLGVVVLTNGDGATAQDAGQASSTGESPTPAPPPAPTLTSAHLADVLLTPAEAADIIDSSRLVGHEIDGKRIFEKMSSGEIVDQECVSLLPIMEAAYQGSGYVAAREQSLQDPVGNKRFTQGAVTFGDAAAASRYVATTKTAWQGCADRSVDFGFTEESEHDFWSVGEVTDTDGVLTLTKTQEGGDGWSCQSALAARNNVVVDLFTCGEHVSGLTAVRLANAMTDKVDGDE